MIEVIKEVGTGSGGTRNISGTTPYHDQLEKKLANFHERDAALIFTSAYVANQTTLATLCKRIPNIEVFNGRKISDRSKRIFSHWRYNRRHETSYHNQNNKRIFLYSIYIAQVIYL